MMTASASASGIITFSTNGAGSQFVTTGTDALTPVLRFGPYTNNTQTGNFQLSEFTIDTPGDTSIQGAIQTAAPEPATMALMGGALFGLGLLGKRFKKK